MTVATEGGAPAPSSTCAEADCDEQRWTVKRRGEHIVVSKFCFQHSNAAMFHVPVEEPRAKSKPAPRQNGLSQFHTEVRRRRLEPEDES